jgi:uncharacterized OB-fold protein
MATLIQSEYTDALPPPAWFRRSGRETALLASRELVSGHLFFPPIPASSPLAPRYETIALSGEAMLYSFTIIHPNKKANKPPFTLVYADFPENVRVFGRYEGRPDARPAIGGKLAVTISEDEQGRPQYIFKPV